MARNDAPTTAPQLATQSLDQLQTDGFTTIVGGSSMPDAPQPMQQQYDDDACDDGAVDVRSTYCYPFGMRPGAFANHDLQAEQLLMPLTRDSPFYGFDSSEFQNFNDATPRLMTWNDD